MFVLPAAVPGDACIDISLETVTAVTFGASYPGEATKEAFGFNFFPVVSLRESTEDSEAPGALGERGTVPPDLRLELLIENILIIKVRPRGNN
jgi:hypothetical protein